MSANTLLPFVVIYFESHAPLYPMFFTCEAEDVDHAEEQYENAYPGSTATWIVQTDDLNEAYDDYTTFGDAK